MLSDFLTLKKVTVGGDFKHLSSVLVRLAWFTFEVTFSFIARPKCLLYDGVGCIGLGVTVAHW